MNSLQPQRKNGLENAARIFQANKINPEGSRSIRDLAGSAEEEMNNAEKVSSIMGRKRFEFLIELSDPFFCYLAILFKQPITTTTSCCYDFYCRFRNVADVALLYAGSTRGSLDQISLVLFPLSFVLFTIIYWTLYLNESRKRTEAL